MEWTLREERAGLDGTRCEVDGRDGECSLVTAAPMTARKLPLLIHPCVQLIFCSSDAHWSATPPPPRPVPALPLTRLRTALGCAELATVQCEEGGSSDRQGGNQPHARSDAIC